MCFPSRVRSVKLYTAV
ncbi:hypothetical protein F383_34824 [Gossypium arboreum]|uniref:Uncharacterized protein n=1 Tax=Gossypium arboreum TaxID=29729 RepID=A0A0B0PPK1_GOSAR|nr:hypothetical protein F383_34824 [Gossypium arboreum]